MRLRRREEKKLRVVLNSGMEKRRRRKGPNSEKRDGGGKEKGARPSTSFFLKSLIGVSGRSSGHCFFRLWFLFRFCGWADAAGGYGSPACPGRN